MICDREKQLKELEETLIKTKVERDENVQRVEAYETRERGWLQEKSELQDRLQKAKAKQNKVLAAIQDQDQE